MVEQIKNIMIVCTGNTCRSPLGHYYLQHLSEQKNIDLNIWSRACFVRGGDTVAEHGCTVLGNLGITSILNHKAT